MSILVLGGAGYIGSHTVKRLIEHGEDVVVADSLLTGHIEAVDKKLVFIKVIFVMVNFSICYLPKKKLMV